MSADMFDGMREEMVVKSEMARCIARAVIGVFVASQARTAAISATVVTVPVAALVPGLIKSVIALGQQGCSSDRWCSLSSGTL